MFQRLTKTIAILLALSLAATQLIAQPEGSKDSTRVLKSDNEELNRAIETIVSDRPPVDEFGVVLANIHDFSPDLKMTAKRELAFSDRLQIISVERDSIADQLGLRPGDQLLQINSFYVARGESALEKFSQRILPGVDWKEPIDATIIRDGFGQSRSNRAETIDG